MGLQRVGHDRVTYTFSRYSLLSEPLGSDTPFVLRGPGLPVLISSLSLSQEICRGRQGPLLWGLGAGWKSRLGCAVMKYIPDEQKWPKWAMITASHGVSVRGNVIGGRCQWSDYSRFLLLLIPTS